VSCYPAIRLAVPLLVAAGAWGAPDFEPEAYVMLAGIAVTFLCGM